jgi:hypothetical protein
MRPIWHLALSISFYSCAAVVVDHRCSHHAYKRPHRHEPHRITFPSQVDLASSPSSPNVNSSLSTQGNSGASSRARPSSLFRFSFFPAELRVELGTYAKSVERCISADCICAMEQERDNWNGPRRPPSSHGSLFTLSHHPIPAVLA